MEMKNHALPNTWKAVWIDPESKHDAEAVQPASVLKRTFDAVRGNSAVLYITCHGLYEATLNGTRIGDAVLAPGTGDYKQRLFVQAYDVTSLLREGVNELCVILGDGWYRGSVGIDGLRNYYGSDLALLCQLEIDGVPAVWTDEQWQASQNGPVRENDLQQGEGYDARMEEITDWHPVTVKEYSYDNLVIDNGVPVLEQERFTGKVITTPNGQTVIDFGQNLAGYTEIKVTAHAGQTIVLRHGETLDENGNFTQANFAPGDRNPHGEIAQKFTCICKEGKNVFKPRFSIYGFRYALVETDIDLTDAEFTAIAVYSKMPQIGWFRCGNEDVNRLFENSIWSMRSNFVDIPTDCPTRERAGWTGDAGVFAPTAVMLGDCYPILRKWLGECRLAQAENGLVQNIAPVNNSGSMISNMLQGSAGWGDACILVPWALYQAYGDKTILEENYDMMRRWLSFCGTRGTETRPQNEANPWKEYLIDQGFHFGEWCQPDINNMMAMQKTMTEGAPEVATAYYYRSASLLKEIAEVLGKREDAEKYGELAENIRNAYRFTCTKDGVIESDRQCEYVRPIAFGLLNKDEAQNAADTLNAMIIKNGYHLNTGFLSTPDLCRVLAEHGHSDTAYKLLLQEECPGWLYSVKKGATTIWETWDGIRADGTVHDSLNHYSYGAVSGWLLNGVCGIAMNAGKLTVKPCPDKSIGFAEGCWKSPYGEIKSAWYCEENQIRFVISVPCAADIELPDGQKHSVGKGDYSYEVSL